MKKVNPVQLILSAILFASVCFLAYSAAPKVVGGSSASPWYSIVPPLTAICLALITGRVVLSLGVAVLVGGLLNTVPAGSTALKNWGDGLIHGYQFVISAATDSINIQILVYVAFVMAMIAVMIKAGGMQGVVKWLSQYAKTAKSTRLATAAMGLALFIDDYANTMIIGSSMRPLTDKMKISREKLAFLVDATAAPVAGIAIVSTWIGYEVGLFGKTAASLGIAQDGYSLFFDALGFRFYCILMIIFVLFNAWSGRDFGPMAKAEKRARDEGKLLGKDARPLTSKAFSANQGHKGAKIFARTALIPIGFLLAFLVGAIWIDGGGIAQWQNNVFAFFSLTAWREVFSTSENSILFLSIAAAIGWMLAILFAFASAEIPITAIIRSSWDGFIGSFLPITILVLAWSLKGACDSLQTGTFLATALGDSIPPMVFPLLVFLVAGLIALATGTSWGTMAILIPTAIPVAFQIDGGTYGLITMISLGAILDGAIFGDHCSPISDTTVLSSIASSCDHIHHVRTQIPYSLVVAALAALCGYLPAALGVSSWIGILVGTALIATLFFSLPKQSHTPQKKGWVRKAAPAT